MSFNAAFNELRDLLYAEPTEENWQKICTILDRCDEVDLETVVDYVCGHSGHWPAGLRVAPSNWIERAYYGIQPKLRAVDAFVLDNVPWTNAEHQYFNLGGNAFARDPASTGGVAGATCPKSV